MAGVGALALTGLIDMISAAFYATTGDLIPWGLGLFVVLQATALARSFLIAVGRNETLLAEKDLLVKEVHHRVKNSLQVVASLVSLQSNRTQDLRQKAVFHALRQRITAIALVHEKLYGQGIGGRPDLKEYLLDLIRLQYPGDGLEPGRVSWSIHVDALDVGVDDCVDTGLILTELLSNAHRHGLGAQGGHLSVDVRVIAGRLVVEVADDGPGFPSDFGPESAEGLGFRVIQALLQRHEGILTFVAGTGARVRVDLKIPLSVP